MNRTKLKLHRWPESSDLGPLGGAGANVRMCTSAPAITHNIYCEQPYCSADGNRFVMMRRQTPDPYTLHDLLLYEIDTYRVSLLERDMYGVATAAWSGVLFVSIGRGRDARMVRIDLNTLEREELFRWGDIPGETIYTVTADQRHGVGGVVLGPAEFGIVRVDMQTGAWEIIYRSPDICNPHLQYRLGTGDRILVQENRGGLFDENGEMVRLFDPALGAGLMTIDPRGGDRREFPVGPPHTPTTTGHEVWIGHTDHALVTVGKLHSDGKRRGTLLEVSHDWPTARVVSEASERWNHISVSRCGRYFITDCYDHVTTPIIIGSIASGKWRVLCEPRTTGGGGQYSHLHPYMTSDNRWVVFNSDRTGVPQVYIAEVPADLLKELDGVS